MLAIPEMCLDARLQCCAAAYKAETENVYEALAHKYVEKGCAERLPVARDATNNHNRNR